VTWPFRDRLATHSAPPGTAFGGLSSFADFLRREAPDLLPVGISNAEPGVLGSQLPHGTTIVALKHPGGVVIAGDRRSTQGNMIAGRDVQKVYITDDYTATGIAGTAAIAVEFARLYAVELEHYEKLEGVPLTFAGKVNRLAIMVRGNLGAALQGLVALPLLAGFDIDDPEPEEAGRIVSFDAAGGWKNQPEPQLVDRREQVLDSMTAYQITSMMEGVVQGGTATVVKEVGKPIAGKTGTTNDEKDAWFIGFSPDIVVGIYMGYDKPRNLGRGATGGHLAAPIARDFLKLALVDKPAIPFRVPAGIKLIRVDAKSGMRAGPGEGGRTILEAFKPGTAPPDNYSVIGVADADGRSMMAPPDAGNIMRPGTGGLY